MDVLFDAYPVKASLLGVRDREDRLTDYTDAGETAVGNRLGVIAVRAERVDPADLDGGDRITRAVILAHADGYLARLSGLPAMLDAIAERHRTGIAVGRLPVRRLAVATVEHFTRYLGTPQDDPLRGPVRVPGSGADPAAFCAERDRLLAAVVHPAIASYRNAVAADVVPHGRPDDRPGLCWLPDGDDYYARLTPGAHHHGTNTGRAAPDRARRAGPAH